MYEPILGMGSFRLARYKRLRYLNPGLGTGTNAQSASEVLHQSAAEDVLYVFVPGFDFSVED